MSFNTHLHSNPSKLSAPGSMNKQAVPNNFKPLPCDSSAALKIGRFFFHKQKRSLFTAPPVCVCDIDLKPKTFALLNSIKISVMHMSSSTNNICYTETPFIFHSDEENMKACF